MSLAPLKKPRTPKAYKRAAVQAALASRGIFFDDWLRQEATMQPSYAAVAHRILATMNIEVSAECVRLWVKKLDVDAAS